MFHMHGLGALQPPKGLVTVDTQVDAEPVVVPVAMAVCGRHDSCLAAWKLCSSFGSISKEPCI